MIRLIFSFPTSPSALIWTRGRAAAICAPKEMWPPPCSSGSSCTPPSDTRSAFPGQVILRSQEVRRQGTHVIHKLQERAIFWPGAPAKASTSLVPMEGS